MRRYRIAAVMLRYAYLLRGSLARSLPLFLWVAIDIVLWGFITRYLNAVASATFDFVPVLLGAALLWDFFNRVMMGVTMVFFEDVWSRNFLNFFATPLSTGEYLSGLVLASVATSLIALVLMIALAIPFGLRFFSLGVSLAPFLLTLFVFGIALGVFACAVVLWLGPAAEWFVWPIPVILSPFAAVFYPVSTLPVWMRFFSHLLPPAYVFENMRNLLAGGRADLASLGLAAVLDAAYLVLACRLYAGVHRHAVRTGLIARYSAETLS